MSACVFSTAHMQSTPCIVCVVSRQQIITKNGPCRQWRYSMCLKEWHDQSYQMLRSDQLAAKSHICVRPRTGLDFHARVVVLFRYCSSAGMLIIPMIWMTI